MPTDDTEPPEEPTTMGEVLLARETCLKCGCGSCDWMHKIREASDAN